MNISQYAAGSAARCSLKERRRRHIGLLFIAQNAAHKPPINRPGLLFIIDGACHDEESEDDEIKADSDMEGCWDIEDRLYEQYKELKIEGSLDDAEGD